MDSAFNSRTLTARQRLVLLIVAEESGRYRPGWEKSQSGFYVSPNPINKWKRRKSEKST